MERLEIPMYMRFDEAETAGFAHKVRLMWLDVG